MKITICRKKQTPLMGGIHFGLWATIAVPFANSIFIESRCHAGKALFLRTSFGINPVNGIASIPFELEKMPKAIAAVEKVDFNVTGQWVCWQTGTEITAAWGDFYYKFRVFGSTEVDLDSPQLLPLGFTLSNSTGTFFVRGRKNGKTVLQSITFSEKGVLPGPVVEIINGERLRMMTRGFHMCCSL